MALSASLEIALDPGTALLVVGTSCASRSSGTGSRSTKNASLVKKRRATGNARALAVRPSPAGRGLARRLALWPDFLRTRGKITAARMCLGCRFFQPYGHQPLFEKGDAMSTTAIPGYIYGTEAVARSPLSDDEFEQLKKTVLFGEDDARYLKMSHDVLSDQVEDVLDVWYGFVASNPHLVRSFADRESGEPIGDYLERVRARFGRWILDTASADYDRAWLDYQHEIGLRHHRTKKNATDGVNAVDNIPLRYVIGLIYPITATLRPFLEKKGHPREEVNAMQDAWRKSVILQVALWAQPYVKDGDY